MGGRAAEDGLPRLLRSYRVAAGLSQVVLAERAGPAALGRELSGFVGPAWRERNCLHPLPKYNRQPVTETLPAGRTQIGLLLMPGLSLVMP